MTKSPQSSKSDKRLDELKQELSSLTEALQRERADSMNLRRRHDEQLSALREVVKADIVKQLLPVIDNFERSLKHIPKDLTGNDYIVGIQSIVKQFEDTLKSLGVKRIQTTGELFDPLYHEAVSMEDGKGSHEIVCEEVQPGYQLGDHVIRHAMVKVRMGDPVSS